MKNLFFLILAVSLFACRDRNKPEVITSELKVNCSVLHHTYYIPYSRVYIKNGTNVWPGNSPSFYDSSLLSDETGRITFSGLSGGKYVFWAVGYDVAVADSVSGYMMINSTLAHGEKKSIDLTIPVSE